MFLIVTTHVATNNARHVIQPITCQLSLGSSLTDAQSNPGWLRDEIKKTIFCWNQIFHYCFARI
jgi:hypothetical protein